MRTQRQHSIIVIAAKMRLATWLCYGGAAGACGWADGGLSAPREESNAVVGDGGRDRAARGPGHTRTAGAYGGFKLVTRTTVLAAVSVRRAQRAAGRGQRAAGGSAGRGRRPSWTQGEGESARVEAGKQPRYRLPGALVGGMIVGYVAVLIGVRELDAYVVRNHASSSSSSSSS